MTKNSIKFFRFFSQKSVRFFEIKFFGSVEFYFLLISKFFRRQQTSSKNNHLRFCINLKIALIKISSPFFDLAILSLVTQFWICLKRSNLRSKRFLVFCTYKRLCGTFILLFIAKCSLKGFSKRNPRSFPPSTIKSVTLT